MDTQEKPKKELLDQWHDDPKNWKLGILYYNKNDSRLFPPKRMRGFGWTVNFANPYSLLCLLGIIIAAVVINNFLR